MKRKRSGLTIVEMLVVVGIIAILIGLLLPALNMVRRTATEAKQKVQLSAIDVALVAFRNDYGDYPPSDPYTWLADSPDVQNTSGAQKLCEAMLGWDLLGFHPDSGWRADGYNREAYRDIDGNTHVPGTYPLYSTALAPDGSPNPELEKRKGRYLDIETANPVRLGVTSTTFRDGLFDLSAGAASVARLAPQTYVLTDVFGRLGDVQMLTGSTTSTTPTTKIKAGLPVLYYRANTSGKARGDVYKYADNSAVVEAAYDVTPQGSPLVGNVEYYEFITDWRASTVDLKVPQKPDSYLLITAGWDGRYGTEDDICNFQR